MDRISASIRDIVDFPKPGIVFKDITPVMRDPALMRHVTEELARPFRDTGVTAVMGMEARGFIFGSLVAAELGVGFIPLRKPGKLPYSTHQVSYDLEYGSAGTGRRGQAEGQGRQGAHAGQLRGALSQEPQGA